MHLCNQIFLVLTGGTCLKSSAGEKDKDWEVKPELKHTTSTSWIAGKAPVTNIKKGTNTLFSKWKSSICIEVKVAQSCPTLCDPMDYRVHEILQARILEWVAFPFSRGSSQPRDRTQVSHIAGGVFTSWATREAHHLFYWFTKYMLLASWKRQNLEPQIVHTHSGCQLNWDHCILRAQCQHTVNVLTKNAWLLPGWYHRHR